MSQGSLEICATMVISTAHLDEKTLNVLNKWSQQYDQWDNAHWISVINGGPSTYGFFFRARPEDLLEETPRCIRDAIQYAHDRGIAWVHYDQDAGEAPDLEIYEH